MSVNISRENMITFLLTTPMFEDLDPHDIGEIIHIVEAQNFKPGDIIFSEGAPGDAWYAIYSGEVEVNKQTNSSESTINTLKPHSCFGEIAVLDGLPRSATIRATKETVVLRVPLEKFNNLVEQNHLVAHKLIRQMALMLASRQRAHTEALSKLLTANDPTNVYQGIMKIVGESSFRE